MSSQAKVTLFCIKGERSTGLCVLTIAQIFPWGAMIGAKAGKWWSVLFRQRM